LSISHAGNYSTGLRKEKRALIGKLITKEAITHNLSEREIIQVWKGLLDSRVLDSDEGEPIEIIYPGRMNDDRGADFRDAVVAIKGRLTKGDIEVHVRSSDWRAHRHHQDPVYNSVILHVVMWHNNNQATRLQNGRRVPIVALDKYVGSPSCQWSNIPVPSAILQLPKCKATGTLATDDVAGFLDEAGEERFFLKVAGFQADLAQMGAGQSLYRGIMGALGYAKNKLPCLELADRLPLQILEEINQGVISDEECLAQQQALLLGTAGLLPSQRWPGHNRNSLDDEWVERLEVLWNSSRCTESMLPDTWRLFKVRPNNSPVRRLVAMSYLIVRYRDRGILKELLDMVEEASLIQDWHRLERGLVVTASGYWAEHFDFGLGNKKGSSTLIGSWRAGDIIANVVLPFTVAWGQSTSRSELEKKATEIYRGYPRLAANAVERHMKNQLGISSSLVNSARRQQGIIHIYNTLCTQGRCACCPLGYAKG
jgi:hypothetical protein